ncbi:MAG: EamA family transporter RarD [Alphaproteobacteria bacterium]|nr:EamA family transporter RarD [Alphaproteobacteria bacterium]
MSANPHRDEPLGILYAGGTYVLWGFVPLYWALLAGVSPVEITLHRILWGALFATGFTALRGRLGQVRAIFRDRSKLAALAASSVLIGVNWTIFIYCVATHQLVESSLGYYLTPLVSMAMGVAMFAEHVSRLRAAAIAMASAAVAVQAVALGHVPWIAPALALSFGFYGYVRKRTAVDSLDGLTVETLLLLPLAAVVLGFFAVAGTGAFTLANPARDLLLVGGGPVTLVPLAMFAAGARRIRMTTLGFLQYLSPSITLLVATLLMGEPFTRTDTLTFAFVWSALLLVAVDGQAARLRARRAQQPL